MKQVIRMLHVRMIAMAVVLAATGFLTACGWVEPGEVQIKGSPSFELPAGTTVFDLTEYIDMDQDLVGPLQESFPDGTVTGGVDPNTNAYTVEIQQSLFDLNTADFFTEEIDLGSLNQTIGPETFEVPEITFDPITVAENVEPIELPAGVSLPNVGPLMVGEPDGTGQAAFTQNGLGAIEITASGYDTITFSQGTLEAEIEFQNLSTNVEVTLSDILLVDPNDGYSTIAPANETSVVLTQGSSISTVTFDLASETLPDEIAFTMVMDFTGGDFENQIDVHLRPSFGGDPRISAASGIDFTGIEGGTQETVPVNTPEQFVSAIIGEGSVDIAIAIPGAVDGWSNITIDLDVELRQGTTLIDSASAAGANPEVTLILNGVSIEDQDFTIDWSYSVSGADASFTLDPTTEEVTGAVDVEIVSFDQLVISNEELDFSMDDVFIVDQELLDVVQSISFATSELQFRFLNALPVGLEVTLSSEVLLGLGNDFNDTFPGNPAETDPATHTQEVTADLVDIINFENDLVDTTDEAGNPAKGIDYDLSFAPSSYDSGTGHLTLTNVEPGEVYSFEGAVELVLDIDTVTVKDVTQPGGLPEAGGDPLDFSTIGDILPEGVNFKDIAANLIISGVDGFQGEIILVGRYSELDGNGDPTGNHHHIELAGDFTGTGDEFDAARWNIANYDGTAFNTATSNEIELALQDVLNARPADLELKYQIDVDALTINIAADGGDPLLIDLNLVLPLLLEVVGDTGDTVEWVLEDDKGEPLLAIDDDLLGRDVLDEDDDISEIVDYVQSAGLHFTLVNNSGMQAIIEIEQGDFLKRLEFLTGSTNPSLTMDKNDIAFIRDNLFIPDIRLLLPAGDLYFNPEEDLTFGMWMQLSTDIDYTFPLGGE